MQPRDQGLHVVHPGVPAVAGVGARDRRVMFGRTRTAEEPDGVDRTRLLVHPLLGPRVGPPGREPVLGDAPLKSTHTPTIAGLEALPLRKHSLWLLFKWRPANRKGLVMVRASDLQQQSRTCQERAAGQATSEEAFTEARFREEGERGARGTPLSYWSPRSSRSGSLIRC
jgi:hypothetical protein